MFFSFLSFQQSKLSWEELVEKRPSCFSLVKKLQLALMMKWMVRGFDRLSESGASFMRSFASIKEVQDDILIGGEVSKIKPDKQRVSAEALHATYSVVISPSNNQTVKQRWQWWHFSLFREGLWNSVDTESTAACTCTANYKIHNEQTINMCKKACMLARNQFICKYRPRTCMNTHVCIHIKTHKDACLTSVQAHSSTAPWPPMTMMPSSLCDEDRTLKSPCRSITLILIKHPATRKTDHSNLFLYGGGGKKSIN